jgi:hypothetical protein
LEILAVILLLAQAILLIVSSVLSWVEISDIKFGIYQFCTKDKGCSRIKFSDFDCDSDPSSACNHWKSSQVLIPFGIIFAIISMVTVFSSNNGMTNSSAIVVMISWIFH